MSDREIPLDIETVLASPHIESFPLIEMGAPSGPIYITGTPFDVEYDGRTWVSLHGLGTIEDVVETDLETAGLVFTLQGITDAAIAMALNSENSVARQATAVHLAFVIDGTLHVHRNVWRGFTQPMQIVDAAPTGTIRVAAESRMATWLRPKTTLFSDADQQRLYPGDRFFVGWDSDSQRQLVWPRKEFFQK